MENLQEEIWKDVVGYEGYYQVSNLANVRSIKTGRVLQPTLNFRGYHRVTLRKGDKGSSCFVHRVVAKSFIPNPDNKPQVNHINGVKTDNRLENLEWNTCAENIRHAVRIGLKWGDVGTANSNAKLKEEDIIAIRNDTRPPKEIAKQYGMHRGTICQIRRRACWKHL